MCLSQLATRPLYRWSQPCSAWSPRPSSALHSSAQLSLMKHVRWERCSLEQSQNMTDQPQHERCYLFHSQTMTEKKPQSPLLVHNISISKALKHRQDDVPEDYIKTVQTEITEQMRETVVEWLLAVCQEEQCQPQIFHLTVNILDRVLSRIKIKTSQLQCLASACLLVSWKIRSQSTISAVKIVKYTSFNVKLEELLVSSLVFVCFKISYWPLKTIWSRQKYLSVTRFRKLSGCCFVLMLHWTDNRQTAPSALVLSPPHDPVKICCKWK